VLVIRLPKIHAGTDRPAARVLLRLGWGAGTVYMKWARIKGDLLAISFWQVVVGVVAFGIAYLVFNGFAALRAAAMADLGRAVVQWRARHRHRYFIWFNIIGGCPTVMGRRLADQSVSASSAR